MTYGDVCIEEPTDGPAGSGEADRDTLDLIQRVNVELFATSCNQLWRDCNGRIGPLVQFNTSRVCRRIRDLLVKSVWWRMFDILQNRFAAWAHEVRVQKLEREQKEKEEAGAPVESDPDKLNPRYNETLMTAYAEECSKTKRNQLRRECVHPKHDIWSERHAWTCKGRRQKGTTKCRESDGWCKRCQKVEEKAKEQEHQEHEQIDAQLYDLLCDIFIDECISDVFKEVPPPLPTAAAGSRVKFHDNIALVCPPAAQALNEAANPPPLPATRSSGLNPEVGRPHRACNLSGGTMLGAADAAVVAGEVCNYPPPSTPPLSIIISGSLGGTAPQSWGLPAPAHWGG
jgi:hypothetical protein